MDAVFIECVMQDTGKTAHCIATSQGIGCTESVTGIGDGIRVLNAAAVVNDDAVEIIGGLLCIGWCARGCDRGRVHQTSG